MNSLPRGAIFLELSPQLSQLNDCVNPILLSLRRWLERPDASRFASTDDVCYVLGLNLCDVYKVLELL